jgi:hypothetical protein
MSGLQDENSFSAGGGTEGSQAKRLVAQIERPDPSAVAATIGEQIRKAKQTAIETKKRAKAIFDSAKSEIKGGAFEKIDDADEARWDSVHEAAVPVLDQLDVISDLKKKLRQAEIDLSAKRVVFSAKKGELKTAYKTAVAAIKEAAASEIANAKSARATAVQSAQEALDKAISDGADTVEQERALADAYDNWQSQMRWEGRKAGFNAVAATVKAIVEAVQTTYRENRDLARANVEVPTALIERHNDGPPAAPM